jgi:hypothetical protein
MEQITLDGITYLQDQSGYLIRRWAVVNDDNVVIGDLESAKLQWLSPDDPGDIRFNPKAIDITTNELWTDIGNMVGFIYDPVTHVFTPPEAPAPRLPTINKAAFLRLIPRASRDLIRQYRRDNINEDLEDMYEQLQAAGENLDLNLPVIQELLSEALPILIGLGFISVEDAARIAIGQPPTP